MPAGSVAVKERHQPMVLVDTAGLSEEEWLAYRRKGTLRGIDMTVQTGEFILLTGRSGCGKTTLIRSLNGLIPHFYPGEIQGDLVMDGCSLLEMKPSQLAGQVGTVFQDPRSQFFMTDTTRELAFGCENMGLSREETVERITKAARAATISARNRIFLNFFKAPLLTKRADWQ